MSCDFCSDGALHLLGYDHASRTEEARMWPGKDEILAGLEMMVGR